METSKEFCKSIEDNFSGIKDPRNNNWLKKHVLLDVIVMSLCAVICGADDWSSIARFSESKEAWFKKFLSLSGGVPSHDTFRRIFCLIDPNEFTKCFSNWTKSLAEDFGDDIIAIDGKSLRHSFVTTH